MSHRSNMLAVLQGENTDLIPWVPRMDLWFRANEYNGTLPCQYQNASLDDILEDNDFGLHTVVPDFRNLRSPKDDADRALCVYNLDLMPYQSILENVKRSIIQKGEQTVVEYETPHGKLRTITVFNESMQQAGITITHVAEHAFKSIDDYKALGYIFENMRIEKNYEGFGWFDEYAGDRGLPFGFVSLAGSPMHLIQRELMPYEQFFFELSDHPDEMAVLAESVGTYWDNVMAATAASSAEAVFAGGNFDASMTYPPFFDEHVKPWLKKFSDILHAQDKYLLCHTDGENTGLLEMYLESGFDIADSICPAPMTKMTMKETREVFQDKITIMGGIPSIALLPSTMPDADFEKFLDEFFDSIGNGKHLILGVSDTTPPDADFNRLLKIRDCIEDFGPTGT